MCRGTIIFALAALPASAPALAGDGENAVSLFGSGIARRSRPDTARFGNTGEVASWEGAVGVGVERRLARWLAVEAAVERRRDIVAITLGGRLCGEVHNTCFDTHRMLLLSTPLVLRGRFEVWPVSRLGVFASAGVRYVPRPSARDLTPVTSVPAGYFGFRGARRASVELGAGAAFRLSHRVALFAEARSLRHHAAVWDPRRRTNAGVRVQF